MVSTLDQARTFLADQPIEGPGEPRKNLQPKTGKLLSPSVYVRYNSFSRIVIKIFIPAPNIVTVWPPGSSLIYLHKDIVK